MLLMDKLKAARSRGVPIVGINTRDPAALMRMTNDAINNNSPKVSWSITLGLRPWGDHSTDAMAKAFVKGELEDDASRDLPTALRLIKQLPPDTIVFVQQADEYIKDPLVSQSVWDLRDTFKTDHRMLILIGRNIKLPQSLQDDILIFTEPLPDRDGVNEIIKQIVVDIDTQIDEDNDTIKAAIDAKKAAAKKKKTEYTGDKYDPAPHIPVTDEDVDKAAGILQGNSPFAIEQVFSLCTNKKGVNHEELTHRSITQLEMTPGLTVWKGKESFADIGGCSVVIDFLKKVTAGNGKPDAIVYLDEIEKMMAGANSDTSGVSQDQLGVLLSYMEDNAATGVIFIGPPGAAKSVVAKSTGNHAGLLTIQLDPGGAKGSLVGESEGKWREALGTISAVSNNRVLFIATCNSITKLPPELRRRFTLGTFFFDLPDTAERDAIWDIYRKKYDIPGKGSPKDVDDEKWTGAEIKQCADLTWRLNISLKEAAAFIVPVAVSAQEQIDALRDSASGRYLSASHAGLYSKARYKSVATPSRRARGGAGGLN